MKRFQSWFQHYQSKLWLLTVTLGVLLALNVAAVDRRTPGLQAQPQLWRYKTIWFRANAGDDSDVLQQRFTNALNTEAVNGWEYVGRCGHTNAREWWIDYVVFKRPRQ